MIAVKYKLLACAASFSLALGLSAGAWFAGSHHGKRVAEQELSQAVGRHQQSMRVMADRLAKSQQQRERVVTRTIEVVRDAEDPTGCADTAIPAGLLDAARMH